MVSACLYKQKQKGYSNFPHCKCVGLWAKEWNFFKKLLLKSKIS